MGGDELLGLAIKAARGAGALLADRFERPRTGIGTKSSGTDMVSDADRAAEALIVELIGARRPDDAILGEESGASGGGSGLRWVIDPLDGTTNFLFGIPQWAVSIACEDADGALAAVVYDPTRDELFAAARGEGATLNGRAIAVGGALDLARALIATGFAYQPPAREHAARMLVTILPRVRDVRRAGAAALDLAWTACGRLDGYYESPNEPWDVAAGVLLVREAGGLTTSFKTPAGEGTIAAGPGIFEELASLVRAVASG